MLARNFNVIKDDLIIFNKRIQINFDEEPSIIGSLNDQVKHSNFGFTLREAFVELFINHRAGVLISEGKAFGVMHYNNKYYNISVILIRVVQMVQRQRTMEELVLLNAII